MGDATGGGLGEEAGCRHHADDAAELRFADARELGDVADRDAAFEGDVGEDLKFTEPLEAGEDLVLWVAVSIFDFVLYSCDEGRRETMHVM